MDRVERLGVVTGLGEGPLSPVGLVAPVHRIGYCTDLPVPIDGCWCGHTCGRRDRQH